MPFRSQHTFNPAKVSVNSRQRTCVLPLFDIYHLARFARTDVSGMTRLVGISWRNVILADQRFPRWHSLGAVGYGKRLAPPDAVGGTRMPAMKLLEHCLSLVRSAGEEFRLKPSLLKVSKTYQSILVTLESIPMFTKAVTL